MIWTKKCRNLNVKDRKGWEGQLYVGLKLYGMEAKVVFEIGTC